jgi:hypothetical protein
MTSNGNTAQKHLIKILTETHPEKAKAYRQAINTAPTKEIAETIRRIYTALNETDQDRHEKASEKRNTPPKTY